MLGEEYLKEIISKVSKMDLNELTEILKESGVEFDNKEEVIQCEQIK